MSTGDDSASHHEAPSHDAQLHDAPSHDLFDHGRISFTLLLDEPTLLDASDIASALARYDEELDQAEVEVLPEEPDVAQRFVARFAGHTVEISVFDSPLAEALIEPTIQLAHYDEELKERARAHRAAINVEYVGTCDPAIIAHVVAAAAAGALVQGSASVLSNPRALTSVPVELIAKSRDDMLGYLRALPPLLFYAGFGKYEVEGQSGLWMRTHGNSALGIPDLARHARGHEEGQQTFVIFSDMMIYMLGKHAEMAAGDVAQIGEDLFTHLRKPLPSEAFLDVRDGPLLVVEVLDHEALQRLSG